MLQHTAYLPTGRAESGLTWKPSLTSEPPQDQRPPTTHQLPSTLERGPFFLHFRSSHWSTSHLVQGHFLLKIKYLHEHNSFFILVRFWMVMNLSKVIVWIIWCQVLCCYFLFAPPGGFSDLPWPILYPRRVSTVGSTTRFLCWSSCQLLHP